MILPRELRAYGSSVMAENDATANVGGAIDLSVAIEFLDISVNDQLQVVSSDSGDTTDILISGRVSSGLIQSETVQLLGQTPVVSNELAWERIMKAQKQGSTDGVVAVEQVTPVATGTLQEVQLSGERIKLAANSSSVDMFYAGVVFRVTSGTGAGLIGKVLYYNGSMKEAVLDCNASSLDNTSVYRLSRGIIFRKSPHEILTVRRPFYNVIADVPSGSERIFYEKFFWRNNSAETLADAYVEEYLNPTSRITFAIESSYGGSTVVANRRTAPTGLTFDRLDKSVPTTAMLAGQALAVWLKFVVPAGQSPTKSVYSSRLQGQTS